MKCAVCQYNSDPRTEYDAHDPYKGGEHGTFFYQGQEMFRTTEQKDRAIVGYVPRMERRSIYGCPVCGTLRMGTHEKP